MMNVYRKSFFAAAVLFCLVSSPVSRAGEISGEEKLRIIEQIVDSKIKEAMGGDALSEVLNAVSAKFPLDTDKDSPASTAYIQQLEEQVRKQYPASDKDLKLQYGPVSEKAFPVYNIGDQVSVIFLLHGKPFRVSGQYYRQDSRFVWVGSKKILKYHLAGEYRHCFDPVRTAELRNNFVVQRINRYHQDRDAYARRLKIKAADKIHELKGDIKYNDKWTTAKNVVLQRYASAIADRNQMITNAIQKAKDSRDYNEKYRILESIIQDYPNYESLAAVEDLLRKFKEEHSNKMIADAIRKAKDSRDYNEKYRILESIIHDHPDYKALADVKALLQSFRQEYSRKSDEIQKIIAYCSQPDCDFGQFKKQYQIDLMDRDLLARIRVRFRGIPALEKLQTVLAKAQLDFVGKIIAEGIRKADASQDCQESIRILKALLAACPPHPHLEQVRNKLQEAEKRYLAILVAIAKQKAEEEAKTISPASIRRNTAYQTGISRVMSDFRHGDVMANNIYQQIQNGTYRTVQMLELIAREFDCPSSSVDRVMSDFRHGDVMANKIYQQIQNGTYRTVQMLELIAK